MSNLDGSRAAAGCMRYRCMHLLMPCAHHDQFRRICSGRVGTAVAFEDLKAMSVSVATLVLSSYIPSCTARVALRESGVSHSAGSLVGWWSQLPCAAGVPSTRPDQPDAHGRLAPAPARVRGIRSALSSPERHTSAGRIWLLVRPRAQLPPLAAPPRLWLTPPIRLAGARPPAELSSVVVI